jgi:major vault protein
MGEASSRERDLVLAPNEFAFISDQTKGNINVYVGPFKTSLANTDQPVVFNAESKRFEHRLLEQSISVFATAPEGWYLVMKNPPKDGNQPKNGTVSSLTELEVGHKVNIPGPISFALWPGQMSRVLKGHHLRSNQYLLVRVYDEESALKHWSKAVIKPQSGNDELPLGEQDVPDLTLGNLLVIKGTEISFYIPPTGMEVVRDSQGQYVREAVTLERLEYCILLDEDGNKRFIQGPDVVFPKPTETFVEKQGTRKFRAIELNENSGLYVKVIAPYEENGISHKVGDELFITGKEQMIYFPRPEHAVIKYGQQEIHYAVAIPAGEGRYVLNRESGQVFLQKGPSMFLPDPRHQVIVRRVLEPGQVQLWFPGNQEALEHNLHLKELLRKERGDYASEAQVLQLKNEKRAAAPQAEAVLNEGTAGDDFSRKTKYTPPRTITLDAKYDGAVSIAVWTGYAILVVSKTGERQVIVGPGTHQLGYDEFLEPMTLSTGTPKMDTKPLKTVYLRVLHNKVSDLIHVETSDFCEVSIELSYRVNFEGNPSLWFNVENYVKFLTEHLRSILRNAVKQMGVEAFYADSIRIIRDTILGPSIEGRREGRRFEENGMHIYDVEVLGVSISDSEIEKMLVQAQRKVVETTLALSSERRRLEFVRENEDIKRQISRSQSETRQEELRLQISEMGTELEMKLSRLNTDIQAEQAKLEAKWASQEMLGKINGAELERQKATAELDIETAKQRLDQRLAALKAEVEAMVSKAEAISPDFIAALQAFGDKALAERMAESMAPLAILGGKSVADVLSGLLKGTKLEHVLLKQPPQN